MTAAEGISLAGLHPATLPLAMLPFIRSRAANQSCRQPRNQPPFPHVFPSYSQQTNDRGHTAQPFPTLTPWRNPHSPRHSRRTTRRRDFVPWRFSTAGRQSAGLDHRFRRSKTCTKREAACFGLMSAYPSSGHSAASDYVGVVPRAAVSRCSRRRNYSITSSASNCKELDTSMPSNLAVCALMTNSNFVDCTTGRSAGFAPLRI